MAEITMRERMLRVLQGKEVDIVPFVIYDGMIPTESLYRTLGPHFGRLKWSSVHKVITQNCKFETLEFYQDDTKNQRIYLHTPIGSLYEERTFEKAYESSSIHKHFVMEKKDYPILWYYLNDSTIIEDFTTLLNDQAYLGEDGIPLPAIERTPYQQLWIQWVGLQDLSYHLIDFSEEVEKTLSMLVNRARKIFEIARISPAPLIDFPDNITALTIGPKRFRQYCVPLYNELADILSERNIPTFSHMDGDLKPLWKDISGCHIGGLDSFTPQPDNDTSIENAVEMFPGKILYVNFPSSVHLCTYDQIRAEAEHILNAARQTNRLQIQISENVPMNVWQTSFQAIIDAIEGN